MAKATERTYRVDYAEEFELEISAEWHFEEKAEADAFAGQVEPLMLFAGGRVVSAQVQMGLPDFVPGEPPWSVELRLQYGFPYVADLTGEAIAAAWENVRRAGAKSIALSAQKQGIRVVSSA